MLTPEKLNRVIKSEYDLKKLERMIDEKIKENHGNHPWEEALLDEEYPIEVRNAIARRYVKAGWYYVYHRTSSENGERGGLTYFAFSQEPVSYFEKEILHIQRSG